MNTKLQAIVSDFPCHFYYQPLITYGRFRNKVLIFQLNHYINYILEPTVGIGSSSRHLSAQLDVG